MANFCTRCGSKLDDSGTCTACAENATVPSPPPNYSAPPNYNPPPFQQPPMYSAPMPPQYPGYGMPSQIYAPPAPPFYGAPPQYPNYGAPFPQPQPFSAPMPPQYPGYSMPPVQPQMPAYPPPAVNSAMPYMPPMGQAPPKRSKRVKPDDSHLPLYGSPEMLGQTAQPEPLYQAGFEPAAAQPEPIPQTYAEPMAEQLPEPANGQVVEPEKTEQ